MKPKPLVALNHFTVPMLTGVVPSQVDIVEAHFSDGLVRSNFWKGRQRLNRLYRWIANVVRPKIDAVYYAKPTPKTILTGAIFERHPREVGRRADIILSGDVPLLENPPTCGGT